jgi:hypothetical protein
MPGWALSTVSCVLNGGAVSGWVIGCGGNPGEGGGVCWGSC